MLIPVFGMQHMRPATPDECDARDIVEFKHVVDHSHILKMIFTMGFSVEEAIKLSPTTMEMFRFFRKEMAESYEALMSTDDIDRDFGGAVFLYLDDD